MSFRSALKLKDFVPSCSDKCWIWKGVTFGNPNSGTPCDNASRTFELSVAFNKHLFNPGSFL